MDRTLAAVLISLIFLTRSEAAEPRFSAEIVTTLVQATPAIRLLADSQLHELYGAPTFAQSALVDKLIEVAMRPSQQRLFSSDLLLQAITSSPSHLEQPTVIHLGDAIDVSCSSEWTRFVKTMTEATRPWMLAPGNHDGFFLGNLLPPVNGKSNDARDLEYGSEGWPFRCGPISPGLLKEGPLSKPDFIARYVDIVYPELSSQWHSCGTHKCLDAEASGSRRVFAQTSPRQQTVKSTSEPWSSFILQDLDITNHQCRFEDTSCQPFNLILLDTSQYDRQPLMTSKPAGTTGSVLKIQLDKAKEWAKELSDGDGHSLFAGHHPLSSLAPDDRNNLLAVLCAQKAPFYISAHTHSGYWRQWKCSNQDKWVVELNLGSVLDWTTHFRVLTVYLSGNSLTYSAELRSVSDSADCIDNWFPSKGSGRTPSEQKLEARMVFNVGSAKIEGRRSLLDALRRDLLEYRSLIQLFPSDAKAATPGEISSDQVALKLIDEALASQRNWDISSPEARIAPERLLNALSTFEDRRVIDNRPERSKYKQCLATWSARLDYERQHRHAAREASASSGNGTNTFPFEMQSVTMTIE